MRIGISIGIPSTSGGGASGSVAVSGTLTEGQNLNLTADPVVVGAGTSVEFFGGSAGTTSISTDASGPPWTATDLAVTPGTKLYRFKVDGGAYSAGTSVNVAAIAPTLTEPDGGESISTGDLFEFTATTFNDAVTSGVTFRVTGPGGYDQTFAGVLDTGVWEYAWDTTGLTDGAYVVRAIRAGAWGTVESATATVAVAASGDFLTDSGITLTDSGVPLLNG